MPKRHGGYKHPLGGLFGGCGGWNFSPGSEGNPAEEPGNPGNLHRHISNSLHKRSKDPKAKPNPPRPLASRRVEVVTQQQTLTSQNLQTNLLGGGFTLPLPPPRPLGSDRRSQSWRNRGPLDPSKSFVKMCLICLWAHLGPIEVAMLTTLAQKNRNVDDYVAKKSSC